LIGKTGQEKAKDFLLKWWVRFDDVRWKNFGREEGLFSALLIERWFGKRIWGIRRITSAITLIGIFSLIWYLRMYQTPDFRWWCINCDLLWEIETLGMDFIVFTAGFCISVSLTKFISFRMAHLCDDGTIRNLVVFILTLIINYLMLLFWVPITGDVRDVFRTCLAAEINLLPKLYDDPYWCLGNHGIIPILIENTKVLYPRLVINTYIYVSVAATPPCDQCRWGDDQGFPGRRP
jgi:hypothetical protein